jgi:hypothetical protein
MAAANQSYGAPKDLLIKFSHTRGNLDQPDYFESSTKFLPLRAFQGKRRIDADVLGWRSAAKLLSVAISSGEQALGRTYSPFYE